MLGYGAVNMPLDYRGSRGAIVGVAERTLRSYLPVHAARLCRRSGITLRFRLGTEAGDGVDRLNWLAGFGSDVGPEKFQLETLLTAH